MRDLGRHLFVLVCLSGLLLAQSRTQQKDVPLSTSKTLHLPAPGSPQRTNSLPTAVALSPDGKYLAILNNGYGSADSRFQQSIAVLDLATNQLRDFPDARLGVNAKQTYFLGLAWGSDGRQLYASIASLTDPEGKGSKNTGNGIAVYRFDKGALTPERFIKLPLVQLAKGQHYAYAANYVPNGMATPYPAGVAVLKGTQGDQLLVAENLADDVVLLDTNGKVLKRFDLSRGELLPSQFPYAVIVSKDGARAWCSLWNGSAVAEINLRSGQLSRRIDLLPPDQANQASSHPTALLLSPDERQLYVTLSNRDSVALIATSDGKVESYLDLRLPGQKYVGSFPNALAQSADGKKLYIANASSDAVAVFDMSAAGLKSGSKKNAVADDALRGGATQAAAYFIPTEWYPTALAIKGEELFVATGKGQGIGPNAGWGNSARHPGKREHPYIASMIHGSIARVNLAQAERARVKLSEEVLRSNRTKERNGEITFAGRKNPIRHVIYVIKENRTYDQFFGDIREANGDRSLVMYGEQITPNQHKLARQFGVLDNFYVSGEVSGNGHVWSNAAITSDYTEKTWEITYRGDEHMYDYEGYVGDYIPMESGVPDVNEPSTGYLWGNLARHNLSHRNYGEYVSTAWCEDEPGTAGHSRQPGNECSRKEVAPGEDLPANLGGGKNPYHYTIPLLAYDTPTKPELKGHFDPNYADFKISYPDQFRADEFLREFGGYVKARQSGSGEQLPNFVLLRLPNDHTAGTTVGLPTPNATVADNDLAVGRVVEAVSNSPYWDDTAIFILEDDAQNGADHVDAHRSLALVISKYAPRKPQTYVNHDFYTTVNLIHTMETLLGLPPMNANDAYAPVMAPLFTGTGDQAPFKADYRNRDNGMIYEANGPHAPGSKESAKLDFSHADGADTEVLNRILWREAKGNVPMPKPRHTVFPASQRIDADD